MIKHAKNMQEFLLDSANSQSVSGIAFDGCYFYLLDSSVCKVFQYNTCFEYLEDISTNRVYSSLCYDSRENCFWASSKECPNLIFQLNPRFQEMKEIPVCYKNRNNGLILGISANCKCGILLLAFTWGILELNPCNGESNLFYETKQGKISGVLSIAPGCLVTRFEEEEQSVLVLNNWNQIIGKKKIEDGCVLKQIIYDGSQNEENFYSLLTLRDGCSKIIRKRITEDELGFRLDCCNEVVCCRNSSECECECECCKKEESLQSITEKIMGTTSKHIPCCCKKADVLESFALTGAALSHILNAEGEKLQKVLACTDDISTILCVNKSIQQTIIHITKLEQVLYEQMLAIEESCCGEQECTDSSCIGQCGKRECTIGKDRNCKEDCSRNMCCERMCCERLYSKDHDCANCFCCRGCR